MKAHLKVLGVAAIAALLVAAVLGRWPAARKVVTGA